MRAFVFLLILANLLFFAWGQGYFGSGEPDALRLQQQLLADQVKIVARDELPPEMKKAEKTVKVPEKKAQDVCVVLKDLPVADMASLESMLSEKFPAFKSERVMNAASATIATSASYWVYIPPLSSKQEAEKKAAELKKLHVPEFFIVQEAGPMRNAISLGIFSSKAAATERLEQLRAKTVKSAKVGERDAKSIATSTAAAASGSLEVRGPEAQADALRLAFSEKLPKSTASTCKAQEPTAQ